MGEITLSIEYEAGNLLSEYKDTIATVGILEICSESLDEQIAQTVLSIHKCQLSSIFDLICEDSLVLIGVYSTIAVFNIFILIVFAIV